MDIGNLLKRKITATFIVTIVTSIILAFLTVNTTKQEPAYELGANFLGWLSVYGVYAGAIILIYGNFVSAGIEFLQQKGFIRRAWIYILLHGIFGSANGLLFQDPRLALYGMAAAVFYAFIDKWLYRRMKKRERLWPFYLVPILVCGLFWGYFQWISEPLPPFTAQDAVERVTESNGTAADLFSEEIGKREETIDGYHVVRETSAEEIGSETYLVTLTETWQKGKERGSYEITYEVDRHSLTARDLKWDETPPYYDS